MNTGSKLYFLLWMGNELTKLTVHTLTHLSEHQFLAGDGIKPQNKMACYNQ